jgi:diadenylate cyclase
MNEILTDLEEETSNIIKDYSFDRNVKARDVLKRMQVLTSNGALEDIAILKLMGYQGYIPLDENKQPRGYRILNKIPRLPIVIIENIITSFGEFSKIISATVEELDDVEGIGEIRAKKIKEGLKLIKERLYTERQI